MTPSVIRSAFDWFQASFVGDLKAEAEARLSKLKARAQERNTPEPFEVGLIEMFVQPKAHGFWTYGLTHPEFDILLAPKAPPGAPKASVRLSAFGCSHNNVAVLWEVAQCCLDDLGDFLPQCVSRADVAVDFQGWEPTPEDMAQVVCPASYRATHGSEAAVGSFYFGKGQIVLRLYDKSTEIVLKKKVWVPDVWRATGRYDARLPVWRAEVQFRTQVLQELGLTHLRPCSRTPVSCSHTVLRGRRCGCRQMTRPRLAGLRTRAGLPFAPLPSMGSLSSVPRGSPSS
ncbi:MAG: hypothetical protein EG823_00255 [Actinobacteria bacterium]|nr:hypothetical protein [Actinomycetota bacterium]